MIMPGMKIKIPSSTKTVKHDTKPVKETKKEQVKQPYKDISPKPMPVIKEDDKHPPKEIKPEKPKMPEMPVQPIIQMPILEQDFDYHTTVKFPEMPKEPKVKKETPKPQPKPQPKPYPVKEGKKKEMPPMQPMPVPMSPCCYVVPPCFAPMPYPIMTQPFDFSQHHVAPMETHGKKDCGCQGSGMYDPYMMPQPMYEGGSQSSSGFTPPHQQIQQTNYTSHQHTQQPSGSYMPSYPQQSSLYPPPLSGRMNQPYPSPPGYRENHHRNDGEKTDNEEE
jgi:morphogenetic protein associated with SpoVID